MRIILILLLVSVGPVQNVRSDPIVDQHISFRLATGMKGGTYYEIARFAEKISTDKHVHVVPVPTQGSWEALLFLHDKRAQFALAQWDAVLKYINYTLDSSVMAVRPLYKEYLHIIVREPLELLDVSEFAGKRVFLGPEKSGTAITANNLFEILGISSAEFQRPYIVDLVTVPRLLRQDSLDIVMHVGPLGSQFVQTILDSVHCRLFSLNMPARKRITLDVRNETRLSFEIDEIPPNVYTGQAAGITTVSIPSVLMSLRDIPSANVSAIDTLIRHAVDSVARSNSRIALDPPTTLGPLPPSIVLYDESLWPRTSSPFSYWLNIVSLIAVLVVVGILLRKYSFRLFRYSRSRTAILITGGAGIVLLICSVGIYSVEHSVNSHFESLYETAWSMLVYLTSGLEDRAPVTAIGRILGSVLLLAGPAFIAVFTGFLASNFVIKAMERKMTQNLRDHYVMLNWNSRSIKIIKQIHSPSLDPSVIVVVSDDPTINFHELQRSFREVKKDERVFEDVYFCPGDPTEEHILLRANVEDAKSVIILASSQTAEGADEKTFQCLSALRRIGETQSVKFRIVLELTKVANVATVECLARDFPGTIDYVSGAHIRTLLLAQSAIIPGLTEFFRGLLSFSSETNELYDKPIPASAEGLTFPEYASKVLAYSSKQPMIPVGVKRIVDGVPVLITNPQPSDSQGQENPFYRLRKGDELLVISYEEPDQLYIPG